MWSTKRTVWAWVTGPSTIMTVAQRVKTSMALLAAITLLGNRHDRGINHLAATGNVALRLQMSAKALEQLLDQPSLPQRLTEQPQRRAVGNAILNAKPQKPCER